MTFHVTFQFFYSKFYGVLGKYGKTVVDIDQLVSSSTTSHLVPGSTCREVDVSMGTSDDQKALVVTYQRLRPGVDIKRGIPEDGHRGWKKYGSKSIQNANFCR